MMLSIGFHKFADVVFGTTQKLLYINKMNKGIFLDLFCNLKSDWSLVPELFYF